MDVAPCPLARKLTTLFDTTFPEIFGGGGGERELLATPAAPSFPFSIKAKRTTTTEEVHLILSERQDNTNTLYTCVHAEEYAVTESVSLSAVEACDSVVRYQC